MRSFLKKCGIVLAILAVIDIIATIWSFIDNREIAETRLPDHTDVFYVEDYSGVLNDFTETVIFDEAIALNEATKAQVCVVTVPNTQEDSLEVFSRNLANYWGIGDAGLDNGVLLLFVTDPDYPHVRLEVGRGLEGAIPDGKAGQILDDYAVEAKNNGRWNEAAGNTFVNVVAAIYDEYGIDYPESLGYYDWDNPSEEDEAYNYQFTDPTFPETKYTPNTASLGEQFNNALIDGFATTVILVIVVIGLILVWLFFSFVGLSGGGGSGGGRSSYSGGGGGYHGGGGSFGGGGASR
ncbi:MAG: TPM domain-containing protein [Lachnospiraceae bacterium]|nr:TPM domain-containing protein [Lachnospiraceae bacterium]